MGVQSYMLRDGLLLSKVIFQKCTMEEAGDMVGFVHNSYLAKTMRKQQPPTEIVFSFFKNVSYDSISKNAGTHFQTYYLSAKELSRSLIPHTKKAPKSILGVLYHIKRYYWLLLSFIECRKLHYEPLGKNLATLLDTKLFS